MKPNFPRRNYAESSVRSHLDEIDPNEEIYGCMSSKTAIKMIMGDENLPGVNRDKKIKTQDLNSNVMRLYYEAKAIVYTLASRFEKDYFAFLLRKKANSAWRMYGNSLWDAAMETAK